MRQKINEAGRTMLEMMGVLAIMGLIMYGAVVGIGFGVDLYKTTATHSDIEEMTETILDLYSWSGKVGTTANQDVGKILCSKNLAWSPCGEKLLSRWTEGHIYINADVDNKYFIMHIYGIPEMACNRLEKMDYQNVCVKRSGAGGRTNCENLTNTGGLYLVSIGADRSLCDDP